MISKRVLIVALSLLAVMPALVMAQGAIVNVDWFVVNQLSIDPSSQLNLDILGGYGHTTVTPYAQVEGYVITGCNGLVLDGVGINSSAAATDPDMITAVGIMNGDDAVNLLGLTEFQGLPVGTTDSLLLVTKYGDSTLDGIIDGTDYAFIDYGYQNGGAGWILGDYTYDGVIDGTDYAYIDYVYQNFSAAAGASAAAVPEPSTVILLISAVACAFGVYLRKR